MALQGFFSAEKGTEQPAAPYRSYRSRDENGQGSDSERWLAMSKFPAANQVIQ